MMEEEAPQEGSMTLSMSHDAAVAIGAASLHYRACLAGSFEVAPTIAHLDEVYRLIVQHPQLSPVARELLRDMCLIVAGGCDAYEEGTTHASTCHSQG